MGVVCSGCDILDSHCVCRFELVHIFSMCEDDHIVVFLNMIHEACDILLSE